MHNNTLLDWAWLLDNGDYQNVYRKTVNLNMHLHKKKIKDVYCSLLKPILDGTIDASKGFLTEVIKCFSIL